MERHPYKPNSLRCTICLKRSDGRKYFEKRKALVEIYTQLLEVTQEIQVAPGGAHLAKLAVMTRLRNTITNLGGYRADGRAEVPR